MRKLPSFTALRSFEIAAKLSSFKDAAAELNLSTSAISHQIRSLENSLDTVLFVRHGGGVELTDAGRLYLKCVSTSLDQLERGTLALQQLQQDGQIRLSLLSSFSTLWLIPNLVDFNRKHPEISIELADDSGLVDFSVASVDAAIRYDFSGTGHWQDVVTHPLFEEWIVPVCSPAYFEQHKGSISLEFDHNHCLLVNKRHEDEWNQWFIAQNLPFDSRKRANIRMMDTSNMTLTAATKGMGLALGRTPFIDQYLDTAELVRMHGGVQFRGVRHYLVYPAKTAQLPGFAAFRDWLIERSRDCNNAYARLD